MTFNRPGTNADENLIFRTQKQMSIKICTRTTNLCMKQVVNKNHTKSSGYCLNYSITYCIGFVLRVTRDSDIRIRILQSTHTSRLYTVHKCRILIQQTDSWIAFIIYVFFLFFFYAYFFMQ